MLGVLGAGSWGTSLALQACRSGQPVCLWEHDAEVAKQLIHAPGTEFTGRQADVMNHQ